jgi:hypothetical protein
MGTTDSLKRSIGVGCGVSKCYHNNLPSSSTVRYSEAQEVGLIKSKDLEESGEREKKENQLLSSDQPIRVNMIG